MYEALQLNYFRFYNHLRPHQALGYRTPAAVPRRAGVGEEEYSGRSLHPVLEQNAAGAAGFFNSALTLSK